MDKVCYVKGFKIYKVNKNICISIKREYGYQIMADHLLEKGYTDDKEIIFTGKAKDSLLETFPMLREYVFEFEMEE